MKAFAKAVEQELERARVKHPGAMPSMPHAVGVIREEYVEAETEFFRQHLDRLKLLEELVQLAAMCQRAAEDLGLIDDSPNVR